MTWGTGAPPDLGSTLRRIVRAALALVLLVAGCGVMVFGVITAVYNDPIVTTLIVLGVGLILVLCALWAGRGVLRR